MSQKLNNFINEYNFKYKNKFIYLWIVILISYYEDKFNEILEIYLNLEKLSNKRLLTLQKLIKNNDIFFEENIIDFFYRLKNKKCNFNIYDFVIESLNLIDISKKKIEYVYFVYMLRINFNKKQKECLQELLIFNNMVVKYLKN